MRRKNRKWVAMAVGLYLFVMWSAYRWGDSQRFPDGNLMTHLQHEGIRRQAAERARQAASQPAAEPEPQPTGELRLTAAGPAYVAARYDDTHIVFIVTTDTEARFSASPRIRSGSPPRVAAAVHPAAPLAGLQELWEPDSRSLHFFPKIVQETHAGDQWTLNVAPDLTIPVNIERAIVAPTGCSLALGFLASVPRDTQKAFAQSPAEYFAVRRNAVGAADPVVESHIAELGWKAPPAAARQIEQQLNDRMRQEVAAIDATLVVNAGTPGAVAAESPFGSARPRLKEWLHADQGLMRGEGKLEYDVRAFRLTPDGAPRLYARARWTLDGARVFMMTAWFKMESSASAGAPLPTDTAAGARPVLLFADSRWSKALREGEIGGTVGDGLDFENVLNEFDADRDGWAELLIHSYDVHASSGATSAQATILQLSLYTDRGLVPIKQAFRRDNQLPASCVDP